MSTYYTTMMIDKKRDFIYLVNMRKFHEEKCSTVWYGQSFTSCVVILKPRIETRGWGMGPATYVIVEKGVKNILDFVQRI